MFNEEKLRKGYSEYKERILQLVEKKIYAYERYGIEFSSLLIYSDEPIELPSCKRKIRKSDQVFRLEENLYLVVYDVISPEDSMKAAQNLLLYYQQQHLKQDLCLAIAPAEQEDTAIDMASRLFIILEYALKESCTNSVVDITQMRY